MEVSSLVLAGLIAAQSRALPPQNEASALQRQFYEYSGSRLVFKESKLPTGRYHDRMDALDASRRAEAARIALREVKRYPRGYLGEIGLQSVGLFATCVGETSDGYRVFEPELGGYRYFGMWTSSGGIAAAYYSDGQLPSTLHHEIFHHVDSTHGGHVEYDRWFSQDDRVFSERIAGEAPLLPPAISLEDLRALRSRSQGIVLHDVVSAYTAKSPGEDQAETAWHLQLHLADSLVQVMEHPEWPGSQRLMHVLQAYDEAHLHGLGIEWWVDRALLEPPVMMARSQPMGRVAR